jgi:hypothetical protein
MSYERVGETLKQVLAKISESGAGKKVYYVVPEQYKSYGLLAYYISLLDPKIDPSKFVSEKELRSIIERDKMEWRAPLAAGEQPNGKEPSDRDYLAVILDDITASGESARGAIQKLQNPQGAGFNGQVILANLVFNAPAIEKFTGFKNLRIISGIVTGSDSKYPSQEAIFARGGKGNQGYGGSPLGLLVSFPWMAPNNNSLLGAAIARLVIPPATVKSPAGSKNKTWSDYWNDFWPGIDLSELDDANVND